MEDTVEDNTMLLFYNKMQNYNFKKPFRVTVEEIIVSNERLEDTNNGGNERERVSVYFQKENKASTIKNKENFNSYDNYNVFQTDSHDVSRFNKIQECTNPPSPNRISELLYTKELRRSSKPNSVNYNPISSGLSCSNRNIPYCNSNFNESCNKLHILSMNLINIIQAHSHYSVILSKNTTVAIQVNARKKYEEVKNFYFQYSREIVEQEILPQRNNIDFIKGFLNKTLKLAIHKNFYCIYKDLEWVYHELMEWVIKQKTILHANKHPLTQITGNSGYTEASPQRQHLDFNYNTSNNMEQSESSINERLTRGPTTCLLSYGSPNNEFSVNISTDLLNNINRQNGLNNLRENDANNKCNPDQVPFSLLETANISSKENGSNSLICETSNHESITQSSTRSISRDSGFMSPRTKQNYAEQSFPEPYITHVTSLNPCATYISPGNCIVCGTSTSTKCLGCFNIYYCSTNCQFFHWTRHKDFCKNPLGHT